jgi:hypothetical protein
VNTCPKHAARFRGAETFSRPFAHGLLFTIAAIIAISLCAAAALAQVPFLNAPLSPGQKAPGAPAFTLTVYGTGFASDAVVNWNGAPLVTTFKTSEELQASVPASNVAKAQTALVTVTNGSGIVSNVDYFQVVKNAYPVAYGKLDYATDPTPQAVTTADFNGDGKLDLAVATGNNSVSILLGNGTGTFPTHVQYAMPGNPVAIVHGDFNGDGKQDIATADQTANEISVLLGNGDGTFQSHHEYATGPKPMALATADVNGDGNLDIIVADYSANKVSVLLGDGDGTFKTHVDYATGHGPSGVAVGDLNGDGRLDLVVSNKSDNTVSILLGNGDGTFQSAVAYATATMPNSVVAGNFTGSNILDLAVGTSNKVVSVLLGAGDGTFRKHVDYKIGANAMAIAAADLSSTGKLSLIAANYNDNTISTLVGNGDGTFKSQSIFLTNGGPSGLAIGDFNGNGKLDVAVAAARGNTVSTLLDSWITIFPTIYSFGTQTSGEKSAPKTFTIKNNGPTPHTTGSISFVEAYGADFTQTNTCGVTLAAGASCTLSVVFAPTALENANVQLQFTSTNGSVFGAEITGTGNIPFTLTGSLNFPLQLIGTRSKGRTQTFTNNSGVDIYFTSIDLDGVNQSDFTFTTTCPIGGVLPPGASCSVTVYFSPTTAGGDTATLAYKGNFTLTDQGELITGNATAVLISPTSLIFPDTTVGSTSGPLPVTFQNVGPTALPITSISWSGSNGMVFSETNTCGTSVPANSSCTFSFTFSPSSAGTFTETLSIGDPDPSGPQKIKVTGTGFAAATAAR